MYFNIGKQVTILFGSLFLGGFITGVVVTSTVIYLSM